MYQECEVLQGVIEDWPPKA